MIDKQQLAAMGEHMREMEECKQKKHSYAQVMTWAGDYEKIGGHGLIVEMLKSYAELLSSSQFKQELKVPYGWRLVPVDVSLQMQHAYFDIIDKNMRRVETDCRFGRYDSAKEAYRAMLSAAPEYKP